MSYSRQEIFNRLYRIILTLLCLVIPIHDKLVAPVIILFLLCWIAEGNFAEKLQRIRKNRYRKRLLSFAAIYLLYVAGLIISGNNSAAVFQLQLKLSLLIFPLIFATMNEQILIGKNINFLILAYISGCLLSCSILLGRGIINYYNSGSVSSLFYVNLAAHQHAAYFSMYLNLAIVLIIFLIYDEKQDFKPQVNFYLNLVLLFFFTFIILLSSKAGMLTLGLIIIFTIGYIGAKKRLYKPAIAFAIVAVGLIIMSVQYFDSSFNRFAQSGETLARLETLKPDATESTAERILIWEAAYQILKDHFLIGVGTGDVQDKLQEKYLEKGMKQAYSLHLNAHNQYLQTFLAVGFSGLMLLIVMIFLPMVISFRRGNYLYFLFLLIMGFNLMFESMFCRQAGVVFYGFFNALLYFIFNIADRNQIVHEPKGNLVV